MNSFYKNNKQIFSLLLGVLLSSSLHALTINNQPLESILPRGNDLSSTYEEKNNLILLEMENGNLNITWYNINNELKELFKQVRDNALKPINPTRMCNISTNTINYYSAYLVGLELIDIQAKTLKFTRCLFESPLIHVTSNTMNFKDCFFINPQILNIIGDYQGSDYAVIQIVFHDQPECPPFIDGQIDLKDNQTKQTLMLSNVKEIRIEFNPQAWDN